MGFDKSGVRRRFKPRIGARRPGFRKGSGDFKRNQDEDQRGNFREGGRRIRDNQTNRRPLKGRRLIRKPRERPQQPVDKEELAQERKNQMDRQMRQYWIKSGSKKGNEEVKKDTKLATKKMNQEMDEYWKKAKEKKQQAVEPAAEKKAPAA